MFRDSQVKSWDCEVNKSLHALQIIENTSVAFCVYICVSSVYIK